MADARGTDSGQEAYQVPVLSAPGEKPITFGDRPFIYPYSCQRTENDEQENLCIEARAADAAGSQALWAKRTFWVGIVGTVAVIATLIFSAKAALAASRSAAVAERSLVDLERPHVFAEVKSGIRVRQVEDYDVPYASVRLVNYGRHPADITLAMARLAQMDETPTAGNERTEMFIVLARDSKSDWFRIDAPDEFIVEFDPNSAVNGRPQIAVPNPSEGVETYFRIDIGYAGAGAPFFYTNFLWILDADGRWLPIEKRRT